MPKSLNDILKGVRKSTIEKLTTGNNPGVDYAEKMKDGRDFVAQHTIEKHADRAGNESAAGNVKKAEMKRHGHEPKPKDIQVYNKTNQVKESASLNEKRIVAPAIGSKHNVSDEGTIEPHVVTGVSDGVVHTQHIKKPKQRLSIPLRDWAGSSSPIKEAKACESCGKEQCECDDSAEDEEPKHTGKKKEGKQLITDKKQIQEKLTKDMSAGDVIKDFMKSKDPRFTSDSPEQRRKRALAAYYKLHNESIADQRSSKATHSETARDKIYTAMQRKKERMEKEKLKEGLPTPPITFPVNDSREGFKV